MRTAFFALILITFSLTGSAHADGLIYGLPDDGISALFRFDSTDSLNGTVVGDFSITSVGTDTVAGERCRWIEFRLRVKAESGGVTDIAKVLIPEKYLRRGQSPAEHVIRGWAKHQDGEPREFTNVKQIQSPPLSEFLAGPASNLMPLDKIEIDCAKFGKIECAGVVGEMHNDDRAGVRIALKMENRLSEKAPFGVVTSRWTFERKENSEVVGTGIYIFTLVDVKSKARGALPDKN